MSDLRRRDSEESRGLQLVDPSIEDANPREVHLDEVCSKLGGNTTMKHLRKTNKQKTCTIHAVGVSGPCVLRSVTQIMLLCQNEASVTE